MDTDRKTDPEEDEFDALVKGPTHAVVVSQGPKGQERAGAAAGAAAVQVLPHQACTVAHIRPCSWCQLRGF